MWQRCSCVKALLCLILLVSPACATTQATPASSTTGSTLETTGTTYVVQRGTVTKKLEFAGRVAPVEEVPLYFKAGGYVNDVYVQRGDQVKAGDLLADLEPEFGIDSLQNQLASAELNLSLAQARLSQAEQANAHAILRAEVALETAQQELAAARTLGLSHTAAITSANVDVERTQDLLGKAQAQYEEAASKPWEREEVLQANALALREARWNYTAARALYDETVAAEAAHRHEVRIAEIAVEQAEAELEHLKKGVDPALSIEVQGAQQQLDLLKEGAQLVTPVDGEVVSLSLYPGRPVEPFVPVIVIADPSAIEVRASLTDDELEEATEGQAAEVVLSTDPQRTWTGTVRRLPYPYGTGGSIANPTDIDTTARISLDGDVGDLSLGAFVHVTIVLEERPDVLWLPPAALDTLQGRTFVTLRDGGRQRRVDVELGLESQDRVEILEGLREHQVVVVP